MRIRKSTKIIFWAVTIILLLVGVGSALSAARPDPPPNALLIISEVMASNSLTLLDEDGDSSDWIELYNPTSQPVNLSGWSLTDDPAQPQKWSFPDQTLGSGQALLIFASGKNRNQPDAPLHTNFRLRKDGEFLGLYSVLQNSFVDTLSPAFPPQRTDVAYGQADSQTEGYLENASPGQPNPNTSVATAILPPVNFSQLRGFYNAPFTLELSHPDPTAQIRYTTDGSEPSPTHGQPYSNPIPIERTSFIRAVAFKEGALSSPVNTHSYIFLDNVINQPANPPGWPGTWGVYLDYRPYLPPKGDPVPADYEMDPRITQPFEPLLREGLTSIPSLSLVTAPANYDIYISALERGEAWERPVSIEWIDPQNPAADFQINAGLRMQGVSNRWEFMPKKSFRLFFKSKYGASKLNAPIFPGSPVTEFDTLVLRGGANRSYAGYPDAVDYTQVTYARDEWLRASQIEMSGVGSHGTFVHLYLNGLYWGLYNLVERPDPSFAAAYLGGSKEDWFGIKHGGVILNPEEVAQGAEPQIQIGEEISGSNQRYQEMLAQLEQGNLADPQNYAAIKPFVDTAQFSDYIILNLYAGNNDWGDNNWFITMQNSPPGPLRYFVWDAEVTWDEGARLYLGKETPHHKMRPLFLALMENENFKLEFADRLYRNLFNNGPLTDANSQARWQDITGQLDPAIVAESARWGDARYTDNPIDRDDWLRAVENVRQQMAGNGDKLVGLLRETGYYPVIDPPVFSQNGGGISPGFRLAMTAAGGDIVYTTDGSDPRWLVTGDVSPTARVYDGPLTLNQTTAIKARARAGNVWSALHEATFIIGAATGRVQVTEINYNPLDSDELEFIELQNVGDGPLNLANAAFEGINFTFPPNSPPLAPGQRLVLVRDYAAFNQAYPGVTVAGTYGGQLANQGESLVLRDAAGNVLTAVTFETDNGWPVSADGRGDSLLLANPSGNPDDPKNWRAGPPSPGDE